LNQYLFDVGLKILKLKIIMPTKLGQNFLKDDAIVKKIVAAVNLKAGDFVLEIGPGKGILTEELSKQAGTVVAIELDRELCKILRNKFSNTKNVEIIESDVLKLDLKKLFQNSLTKADKIQNSSYRVIANIPYYITSPIIRLFLENENPPDEMILMVQKEVAERIAAKPGKMSILAVSVQYYADAEILFEVGKENFDPVPEVDSAVIRITRHSQLDTRNEEFTKNFFRIVKAGFSAKRKTLANNLANSLHLSKNVVEEKLKTISLNGMARAQELSIDDWKKLALLIETVS
jgi:16S rRNA (adenine1518-N6/adenine1519-N6)-dimethyltransferase